MEGNGEEEEEGRILKSVVMCKGKASEGDRYNHSIHSAEEVTHCVTYEYQVHAHMRQS